MATEKTLLVNVITADVEVSVSDLAKNWGWILAGGVINFIAGILCLLSPTVATNFVLTLISLMLLLAGAASLAGYFYAEDDMKTQLGVLGAVQVLLGFFLWFYPFQSLAIITILIALAFMLHGVASCSTALSNRDSPTWGWTLINGVCAIAFSTIVIAAFPWSSHYTLGILVGVNLVTLGGCRIAIAMAGYNAALEVIEAPPSADVAA